jgi:PAS domain S-box-containing protein
MTHSVWIASAYVSAALAIVYFFLARIRRNYSSALQSAKDRISQLEVMTRDLVEDAARSSIAADAAGLGFWTFDVATHSLYWDEATYRLYGIATLDGHEPEAMQINRLQLEDRITTASSDNLTAELRDYDVEFDATHSNGAVRHLKAVGRIIRDVDGRALRVLGVTFDITERKRSDEQFRLAIEAAPTGMLLTDPNGSIVSANAQIELLFGYPRSELLGQSIEILVPTGFRTHIAQKSAPERFQGRRKDGTNIPVEIGLNPLITSDGEFVLSSIGDLSARLEIDRIRNEFVSTVSHELRTPLTSIQGSLGLLQSGAIGSLSSEAREMVAIAYKNSSRLVRIINDILDIGMIDSGKLTLRTTIVDLGDLLQQAVDANTGIAEKHAVRFVLEPVSNGNRVVADPDRLVQVVVNLLSNAAKFSPPGADVLIRVCPGETTVQIEVEDAGRGISETFKVHVFEKFAQADASSARRSDGTGLGLNIAQQLVQAMAGRIGFYPAAHRGTIFYVELPRSDAPPPKTPGVPFVGN